MVKELAAGSSAPYPSLETLLLHPLGEFGAQGEIFLLFDNVNVFLRREPKFRVVQFYSANRSSGLG